MADHETVALDREGAVARVAFDRPESHNSLNERMVEELAAATHEVVSDDVRCIALTEPARPSTPART